VTRTSKSRSPAFPKVLLVHGLPGEEALLAVAPQQSLALHVARANQLFDDLGAGLLDEGLETAQVADRLGIKRDTLSKAVRAGRLHQVSVRLSCLCNR
jgi:hypothetical protein